MIAHVLRKVEDVLVEGSGFTLSKIINLNVQIFKHESLRGSGFIDLPQALKKKEIHHKFEKHGPRVFQVGNFVSITP